MGMIGIERFDGSETADRPKAWCLVNAAAEQCGDIMRQKTDTVTVHAKAGAVHHGAGCGICGRIISATGGENFRAKSLKRAE
jgi:hypothetical protein